MKKGHAEAMQELCAPAGSGRQEGQVLVAVTKEGSGGEPADSVITS
jgi:hypothetical protein